jgi:hypothetical protein
MSNENKDIPYLKIIKDILEIEMDLKPPIVNTETGARSEEIKDQRVFLWNLPLKFPTFNDVFLVLSESPGKVISNSSTLVKIDDENYIERQEIIMQRFLAVDILSANTDARERKEEILMALASVYSQQQQEANGFRVFSFSTSFIDISEVEGAEKVYRFRAEAVMHVKYKKEKPIAYFDSFEYNSIVN